MSNPARKPEGALRRDVGFQVYTVGSGAEEPPTQKELDDVGESIFTEISRLWRSHHSTVRHT